MAAAVLEAGVYFIQNVGTGTAIDLYGGSSTNGARVQGFAKRELDDIWVPAQLWVIAPVRDDPGKYTIQNANSRTYMDLTKSLAETGAPIIGFRATGNPSQRWTITRNANGTAYVIANASTGAYVDLRDGDPTDGTAISGWTGTGPTTTNKNQLWHIVRA